MQEANRLNHVLAPVLVGSDVSSLFDKEPTNVESPRGIVLSQRP